MKFFVMKITRHDEGTFAYVFQADNEGEAKETLEGFIYEDDSVTHSEILTLAEFLDGDIYELCTF